MNSINEFARELIRIAQYNQTIRIGYLRERIIVQECVRGHS